MTGVNMEALSLGLQIISALGALMVPVMWRGIRYIGEVEKRLLIIELKLGLHQRRTDP